MKRTLTILFIVFLMVGCGSEPQVAQQEAGQIQDKVTDLSEQQEPAPKKPDETLSQSNAVAMAIDYLNYSGFSRSGLIEQLKFEGFDDADAGYAIDQLDVDWKEQAARVAQDYLDYSSFSKSGLMDQLEFEGFNSDEAAYAVSAVGF